MTSTIVIVALSVWMGFVAAGAVWFAWGIAQGIAGWLAGRRTAPDQAEPAKQDVPS